MQEISKIQKQLPKATDNLCGIAYAHITIGDTTGTINTDTQSSISINLAGKAGSYTAVVTLEDVAGNKVLDNFNFEVTTSVNSMQRLVNRFTNANELSGPFVAQLTITLDQAQHQLDIGSSNQAA